MAGNWQTKEKQEHGAGAGRAGQVSVPVLQSKALLQGCTEIGIEHEGVLYRLRHTRQGKLILTK